MILLPKNNTNTFSSFSNQYKGLGFPKNVWLVDQRLNMIILVIHPKQYLVQLEETNNFILLYPEKVHYIYQKRNLLKYKLIYYEKSWFNSEKFIPAGKIWLGSLSRSALFTEYKRTSSSGKQ